MKKNKIYEKWKSLGFLDGLCEKHKIMLANAFEYMANKLLIDSNKRKRKFNDDVDSLAFPILRRIITTNPLNDLTNDLVDDLLDKLLYFTKTRLYIEARSISCCCWHEIDPETELIEIFVKINYGQ
jgi:hypothetical protein